MATRECTTCGNEYENEVGVDSDWYCPACARVRFIVSDALRVEPDSTQTKTLMQWVASVARHAARRPDPNI